MGEAPDKREGWHVHLSIPAREGQALLAAVAGVVEGGASLLASTDSELQELVLFSREADPDRARDAAIDSFQRLRRVAGLDAYPARVVALERPARTGRSRRRRHAPWVRLMDEAERVLNFESHFEWAVVLAQTACEVYVLDIFERLARQLGDDAKQTLKSFPSANLANAQVRRALHELTGYTPPNDAGWWLDYQAHVQRRHRIVHAGARITRRDADDSLEAAKAMIKFLHYPGMYVEDERE